MSKPWKGWAQPKLVDGGDYGALVVRGGPERAHTHPVIVTPIDDESLPHPGDGRKWAVEGLPDRNAGVLIEGFVTGEGFVQVRHHGAPRPFIAHVSDLRERKPEHRPWCYWSIEGVSEQERDLVPDCTCERRSGEDRRQGERRRDWPYHVAREDRRHTYGGDLVKAKRGGRSGEDRRAL